MIKKALMKLIEANAKESELSGEVFTRISDIEKVLKEKGIIEGT